MKKREKIAEWYEIWLGDVRHNAGYGEPKNPRVPSYSLDTREEAEKYLKRAYLTSPKVRVVKVTRYKIKKSRTSAALDLLREVYESQNAACVGGTALPCGSCLWCRVRAQIKGKT